MPTRTICAHCDPRGSGRCKVCQATGKSGRVGCGACQGTGYCGECYGYGFEPTRMEKISGVFLSVWVICWLGIITGFVSLFFLEYRTVLSISRAGAHFSLALFMTIVVLWILYFVCDHKARAKVERKENWRSLTLLSMLAGSILAICTVLAIVFFVFVAPRIQ